MKRFRARRSGSADHPTAKLELGAAREVLIERVGAEGDGVALRPDGGRQFVAGLLQGERAIILGEGERAQLVELIAPSPERTTPPCPHYGRCGGCAFQHWTEGPARAFKIETLRRMLSREGLDAPFLAAFHALPGERRRVSLHARRSGGPRPLLGFKGRREWGVVSLETCVVADPLIVTAFPALAELAAAFLTSPKSAPALLVTRTLTGLTVDVSGVEGGARALSADERSRLAALAAAQGLARLSVGGEGLYEPGLALVRHGSASVALPPGGFLQAVERAEVYMADLVVDALSGCKTVFDLFCGTGAFTFALAARAGVTAYDASDHAILALTTAAGRTSGLKAVRAEARDLVRRPVLAKEFGAADAAVLDPPRAGAPQQAAELARSGLAAIVYVSCNPQSFARDSAVLVAGGFSLQWIAPVDQFLWSPHIEVVGFFTR